MSYYELIELMLEEGEITKADLVRQVCPECRGEGESSAYLGAYTQSEWSEMDDEFKDDYLRGNYDRRCDTCNGERVVWELTDTALARPEIAATVRDYWETEAMYEAERRAGA